MKSPARIISLTRQSQQQPEVMRKYISNRAVIPAMEGTHIIPFREIRRCVADGNYCYIHLSSGADILASKTLKYIASLVPDTMFIRVHQSHLVNQNSIRFIGHDHVLLDDGVRVPVSRSRRGALLDKFERMC